MNIKSKLLTISQASEIVGVSIQTLRRWDNSGKLRSVRKKKTGNRYYRKDEIDELIRSNSKDLFSLAKNWVASESENELPASFYCKDISVFQARLSRLEMDLGRIKKLETIYPLITAITGEIGNNSFDHNLGNWPDMPGIFFAHDLSKRYIVLADRGQGILTTLKKVKPNLSNHQEALKTAFTEIVSGRAPEYRGNGLKFVKEIVETNEIGLIFYTGDAKIEIQKKNLELNIKKSNIHLQGCLALIKF
jgi:DNA-binding transcriptional MerR regulator